MTASFRYAGGVFRRLNEARFGAAVDSSALDPADYPPALLEQARAHWRERARTEFRSIQIMTRFLEEVVGAGDPLDVYAGAIELVEDEIRHTQLCVSVCEALAAPARLPDPVRLEDPERFVKASMAERALTTAISMLAINETISTAFISDLRGRCENPPIRAVLDATVEDEEGHQEFGWAYIERSLARFPRSTLRDWQHLVTTTLEPHHRMAEEIVAGIPEHERTLEAWPDREPVRLGLFSPQRQALVFHRVWNETLRPRLEALQLLGTDTRPA